MYGLQLMEIIFFSLCNALRIVSFFNNTMFCCWQTCASHSKWSMSLYWITNIINLQTLGSKLTGKVAQITALHTLHWSMSDSMLTQPYLAHCTGDSTGGFPNQVMIWWKLKKIPEHTMNVLHTKNIYLTCLFSYHKHFKSMKNITFHKGYLKQRILKMSEPFGRKHLCLWSHVNLHRYHSLQVSFCFYVSNSKEGFQSEQLHWNKTKCHQWRLTDTSINSKFLTNSVKYLSEYLQQLCLYRDFVSAGFWTRVLWHDS